MSTGTENEVPFGFVVNGKWYINCGICGEVVRFDKPILGSMHFCISEDERAAAGLQQGRKRGLRTVKKS